MYARLQVLFHGPCRPQNGTYHGILVMAWYGMGTVEFGPCKVPIQAQMSITINYLSPKSTKNPPTKSKNKHITSIPHRFLINNPPPEPSKIPQHSGQVPIPRLRLDLPMVLVILPSGFLNIAMEYPPEHHNFLIPR